MTWGRTSGSVGGRTLATVAALAATVSGVRADELASLKAEIMSLEARLSTMEANSALPSSLQALAIWEGEWEKTPGAPSSARARAAFGRDATYLGLLPAADRPAAATIAWSGYVRSGLVYEGVISETRNKAYVLENGHWVRDPALDVRSNDNSTNLNVSLRGQLRVKADTETSVGKIGAEIEMRADGNVGEPYDLYGKIAWGYWAMTPALTFGGGYHQSIGDISYGYDGSCTCYFTDNADVGFNPGDTTQLRLSYKKGHVTVSAAVESSAFDNVNLPVENDRVNAGLIGVAGQIAYKGPVFSGELAGVWHDSNELQTGSDQIWQLGLGGKVKFGERGFLSVAAATGEGPYEVQSTGVIITELAYNNLWWGVNALASVKFNDKTHLELAGGYKNRRGDQSTFDGYAMSNVGYETYAAMGGLYYTPVKQLTFGLESEWYTTSTAGDAAKDGTRYASQSYSDTLWADVVAVWRF